MLKQIFERLRSTLFSTEPSLPVQPANIQIQSLPVKMHPSLPVVACVCSVLGPLSHVAYWRRYDFDNDSYKILVFANLVVLLSPITLLLRGFSLFDSWSIPLVAEACYAGSLFASIGLYRGFLHPLRKFPGPFWAQISVFWKVKQFQSSDFKAYAVIDDLHQKYGDVVRIAPRQVSINDPSAVASVYGLGSECSRLGSLQHLRKNLQSLANKDEHKARRTMWEHGLNAKACQSYLPRINERTDVLIEQLEKRNGQPTLINDWCHYYTFDIMGDLGFGQSYGQLEAGSAHPAIEKVQNFLKAGVIAVQMIWVVNTLQLIPGLEDPMQDLADWSKDLLEKRAKTYETEKEDDERKDLMSYVYQSQKEVDSRWPMTEKDLYEDAVTLQIAGSDTSYSVLVHLCHYLAQDLELQERVRAEILASFEDSKDGTPAWSKLASQQQCPWLDAVVHEILRIHPPVPQGMARETPESHAVKIGETIIPPKTILSCPTYTMHHDARNFAQPEDFVPERWLEKSHPSSKHEMVLDRRAFVPFSIGPMNCAGRYFAYMEIKVFAAKMLKHFEISFPDHIESGDTEKSLSAAQVGEMRESILRQGTKDYLTMWASDVEVCFKVR